MKYILGLSIGLFLVLTANTTASARIQGNNDTLVVKTAIYCSHCLECESCKGKLDLLLDEKGVQEMKLDVEKMTILVVYNAKKTNPAAIRKAISNLGYDADDVPANPDAYKELDGCCKKK